ncbi:hypothetical protein JVU11DRAFT_12244 [Chiua virens]|nr:hypothetical protein JVU11DRAFT_12244 [Chiua virens]
MLSIASPNYLEDISHWTQLGTQYAACSFEPGTPEDVGVALQILGRTRTPFGIKGGGHAVNPGFSSSEGIQIAMSRFSEIVYDSTAELVTVGAGLLWDDVYEALNPHGVSVAGGRILGVGVAGFTLSGGYSWHANQYGLTIDTVQAFELVMPNGTVVGVTETSNPDLFFALKGGANNFGIVTKFAFRTFPQGQIWGGLISYSLDARDQFMSATANFSANNKDPKAQIIAMFYDRVGKLGAGVNLFYDGPTPPAGIFDEFLAIPSTLEDVSTRSFSDFLESLRGIQYPSRYIFNSISVTGYPLSLLQTVVDQCEYWRQNVPDDVFVVSYDLQPFHSSLLSHNTTPSAYPGTRAQALFPFNVNFAWTRPESDEAVYDAARKTIKALEPLAMAGQDGPPVAYPNYALFDTPLVNLYGKNLPRLQTIKAEVDPDNVMGLAGGFKI